MAVAFPSSTSATSADAGGGASVNVNVNPPSGLTAGNTWLLVVVLDHLSSTIATPSGFTAAHAQVDGSPGYPGVRTFWKTAGASESAVNVSASGTDNYILWVASIRATDADTTNPIGNVAIANPSGTGTTQDAPDITVANNGSGVILIGAGSATNGVVDMSITQPTGTTAIIAREGTGVYPSAQVAYELRNAGAYGPGNWTYASTAEGRVAVTIEILPAAVGSKLRLMMAYYGG